MVCEALPALQEAKKAGKIGHTGITGLPLQGILVYPTPAPTLNCCLLPVVDYVLENSEAEIETILTYCCYTIQNVNLDQAPPPSPPPPPHLPLRTSTSTSTSPGGSPATSGSFR